MQPSLPLPSRSETAIAHRPWSCKCLLALESLPVHTWGWGLGWRPAHFRAVSTIHSGCPTLRQPGKAVPTTSHRSPVTVMQQAPLQAMHAHGTVQLRCRLLFTHTHTHLDVPSVLGTPTIRVHAARVPHDTNAKFQSTGLTRPLPHLNHSTKSRATVLVTLRTRKRAGAGVGVIE
jgi:hypothetical protein